MSVRISNLIRLSLGRGIPAQRCARLLAELQIARGRDGTGWNESKVWPGRSDRSKLIGPALSPRRTSCQTKSTVVGKSRKLWHLLTVFGHDLALQRDSSRPSVGESCSRRGVKVSGSKFNVQRLTLGFETCTETSTMPAQGEARAFSIASAFQLHHLYGPTPYPLFPLKLPTKMFCTWKCRGPSNP